MGRGVQDGHLDLHTASESLSSAVPTDWPSRLTQVEKGVGVGVVGVEVGRGEGVPIDTVRFWDAVFVSPLQLFFEFSEAVGFVDTFFFILFSSFFSFFFLFFFFLSDT